MYVIGLAHKYGKSYYNKDLNQLGSFFFATKYETEKEANDATCCLMRFHEVSQKMSYDGPRYYNAFVEKDSV